jgi:hypothetical protein
VSPDNWFEMLAITVFLGKLKSAHGHVQWVPQIVRDDAGELDQALVLLFEFLFVLLSLGDVTDEG